VYSTVNRPNDVALVYLHITHSIKTHAESQANQRREMAGTRSSVRCKQSNSSVFNVRAKVLKSLQDLQLDETVPDSEGTLLLLSRSLCILSAILGSGL